MKTNTEMALKSDSGQLVLPPAIFAEALRLSSTPCRRRQDTHIAVQYLTDWWNSNADADLRGAHSLVLYVRYGENWLAGDPEECWVDAETWARNLTPRCEAILLGGDVCICFLRHAVDEDHGYTAKGVDDSRGMAFGRWDSLTGDQINTFYSHKYLNIFAERFPDAWERIAAELSQPV